MDAQTELEQSVWEHYNKVEAENYHLKKQLAKKHKELKQAKHFIRIWKHKYEDLLLIKNRKPRYRNNGKGGK